MPKYGIALGGGAAKGYAHIGVLKFLIEKNIKITEISGASMGALVGALFAMGKTTDELIAIAREVDYSKMVDVDWDFLFLKGEKMKSVLKKYLGDITFEELKIPLKVVATDLETGERKIFQTGSVLDAVRASVSLPILIKPYEIDGVKYIDGGVSCNLPVDILSTYYKIAVSLHKKRFLPEPVQKKKFLGFELPDGISNLNFQIANKVIENMMSQNEKWSYSLATGKKQFLDFDFWDLDSTSFDRVDEFVKLGYETAKNELVFEKEKFIDAIREKLGPDFY